MGSGKKNTPWTKWEKFMVFNFATGGLCMLITVVPVVPWRYAMMQGAMTQRFSLDRRYSLLHAGNNFGQGQSWFKLRKDTCRKLEEFNRPDPVSGLAGAAAGMMGAGGALAGCRQWPACKDHVALRCMSYSTMAIAGILCVLFQLISCCASFAVPAMLYKEGEFVRKGKTKKLEAAQFQTMMCGIAAFATGFLSFATWTALSASTFKELASRSAYPFPSAHIGLYLALFGVMFLAMGFAQVLNRVYHCFSRSKNDEEENEEYAEADAGAEALMPGGTTG